MGGRVLIINPNSNEAVTAGMARALAPMALAGAPSLDCVTLAEGPFGIESAADGERVALPLAGLVAHEVADAFVIACFSDPGLAVCREATNRPVLGIRECAVSTALARADRFGVIAMSEGSVRRQRVAFRAMGVSERWAGSEPLNLSVAAGEEPSAFPRVRQCGRALVERAADVVILGCAGMARHRGALEAELGVPVIDPTQAAAAMAIGAVLASSAEAEATVAA